MRICNRKLAKRIKQNQDMLNTLETVWVFDRNANLADITRARFDLRAAIKADTETLAQHGYDVRGNKIL